MAIVLKTDGGPHTPDTWAMASAEELFTSMVPPATMRPLDLQALQVKIAADLVALYTAVIEAERARLSTNPEEVFTSYQIEPYLADIETIVKNAAAGSRYEEHFNKQDILIWVKNIIAQHMCDMQHIERKWHEDRQGGNS